MKLKILRAATKTWNSQIYKYIFKSLCFQGRSHAEVLGPEHIFLATLFNPLQITFPWDEEIAIQGQFPARPPYTLTDVAQNGGEVFRLTPAQHLRGDQ